MNLFETLWQKIIYNQENSINGISISIILFLLYLVVNYFIQKLQKKEKDKRIKVKEKLTQIRAEYRSDGLKEKMNESNLYIKISRTIKAILGEESFEKEQQIRKLVQENSYFEGHMMGQHLENEAVEEIQKKSKEVLKEVNSTPWKPFFYFVVEIGYFVVSITFLLKIETPEFHWLYPVLAVGTYFLTNFKKDNVVIVSFFSLLMAFIYSHFTASANLFLILYFIGKKIMKLNEERKIKNKK